MEEKKQKKPTLVSGIFVKPGARSFRLPVRRHLHTLHLWTVAIIMEVYVTPALCKLPLLHMPFSLFFLFETFISCFLHANFTHARNTWNLQSLTVLILKKTENGLTQCFQRRSRFIFQLVLFYWNVSFFSFFLKKPQSLKKKKTKRTRADNPSHSCLQRAFLILLF